MSALAIRDAIVTKALDQALDVLSARRRLDAGALQREHHVCNRRGMGLGALAVAGDSAGPARIPAGK